MTKEARLKFDSKPNLLVCPRFPLALSHSTIIREKMDNSHIWWIWHLQTDLRRHHYYLYTYQYQQLVQSRDCLKVCLNQFILLQDSLLLKCRQEKF